MHHGDLGNAHGGDPRLVGEAARTFDEDLRRVVEVGTTAFGEGHHRQLVLHGDLLQAQGLLQPGRGDGAALDRAVAGTDQAAHPGDVADPGDDPAAGLGAVLVVVQLVAGQRGQFEERRARIEQQRQAFARQQLSAFLELRPGLGGLVQDLLLQFAEAGHGGEHGLAVTGEVLAVDVEFRLDRGHVSPPGPSARRAGRRGGSRCTRGSVPACLEQREGAAAWLAAPSMRIVLPLTKAAPGESRKTMAAATSDSLPMRLSGTCSRRVGITALNAPS